MGGAHPTIMGKPAIGTGEGGPPGPHRRESGVDFVEPVPRDLSYPLSRPRLLVETGLNTDQFEPPSAPLEWSQITEPLDGDDHTCTLTLPGFDIENLFDASGNLKEHFASVLANLTPDRRVRVVRDGGPVDRRVLFQGYPLAIDMRSTPDRKGVSIPCHSEAQEWLRHHEHAQITGAYHRHNPGAAWDPDRPDHKLVTAEPPAFNPDLTPNRSAEPYTFPMANGQLVQLYLWVEPGEPGAGYWSYVQALRTLAYFWVDQHAGPVSVTELLLDTANFATWDPVTETGADPWLAKCTASAASVKVQSLNVDEAFALLCAGAGLHYHVPCRSAEGAGDNVDVDHFVRIIAARTGGKQRARSGGRRMRPPEIHDLAIQKPLSATTATPASVIAERNRVQHFDLAVDRRAITAPTFLGGLTEIEVSCLLRPGWAPLAAHHLDDLDVDEQGEPLSAEDAEANRKAARRWWDDEWSPQWDDEGNPIVPPTKYHRKHAAHDTVAAVFRRWLFPDHAGIAANTLGRKSGPWRAYRYRPFIPADPENPDGPLSKNLWWNDWTYGGGLLPTTTQNWAARRRPFGDTIGRRHTETTERAPIIRIHFGIKDEGGDYTTDVPEPDDAGWVEFTGDVTVLEDAAGIHFGESDFYNSPALLSDPNDPYDLNRALYAYIAGHFWVQITATIRADERMRQAWRVGGGSFSRDRCQIIDTGYETFRRRLRRGAGAGNSYLAGQDEDEPGYENRDDRAKFEAFTEQVAKEIVGDTTAGNFETFFLDDSVWPGDALSGCAGLGLYFNRFPVVTCKQHLGGASPRTQYMLTDMRKNPEVGGE